MSLSNANSMLGLSFVASKKSTPESDHAMVSPISIRDGEFFHYTSCAAQKYRINTSGEATSFFLEGLSQKNATLNTMGPPIPQSNNYVFEHIRVPLTRPEDAEQGTPVSLARLQMSSLTMSWRVQDILLALFYTTPRLLPHTQYRYHVLPLCLYHNQYNIFSPVNV